jgi:mannose-6-phosphate isomerase-like protein (cupin superfamily)
MSQNVIVRHHDEGRTLLVGGSDYVTYKVTSAETDQSYFCFEVSAAPGFGPPLHRHGYRELFYVVEGAYEFTIERDGETEAIVAEPGTTVGMDPYVAHTFRNCGTGQARMLNVQFSATLEPFFEEYGVPVANASEAAAGGDAPDLSEMAAALQRHGVEIVPHG